MSEIDEAAFKRDYEEGMSLPKLEKKYGLRHGRVYYYLGKLGLQIRDRKGRRGSGLFLSIVPLSRTQPNAPRANLSVRVIRELGLQIGESYAVEILEKFPPTIRLRKIAKSTSPS